MSAPAAVASACLPSFVSTSTRTDLPVPCGSATEPRTIWSAWRGSTPSRMSMSTDSSNLARPVCLTSWAAASSGSGPPACLGRSGDELGRLAVALAFL